MTGMSQTSATTPVSRFDDGYNAFKARRLNLNLTRGKPSSAQLDLSSGLLALPGPDEYQAEDGTDCRNYGVLQGLPEARRLFSGLLGAPADQVVVANNSSLALMHDAVAFALLKGTCDSGTAWSSEREISFLCPVPGYDRHFRICQDYGIRMIPVALR